MLNLHRTSSKRNPLEELIRSNVARHICEAFSDANSEFSKLDKWTQRRIYAENMAKVELMLEADDSGEHCYQDLIRELDIEAENGIYLVGTDFQDDSLRSLAADPGISGEMHLEVPTMAQSLLASELERSSSGAGQVWVTIQARYDRAQLDSSVSEIVMRFLLDSADAADDMSSALRAMLYSYHEDTVRHVSGLTSLLDERESRDLMIMVIELEKRSGNYGERIRAICERAGTSPATTSPTS